MRITCGLLLTALFTFPANAQTNGTYVLIASNPVSPGTLTTTIEVWASWSDPSKQYWFGRADYDLAAGEGQFANAVNVLNGPTSSTGIINGSVITGAVNAQLPICGILGCPDDNPILLATYEWTTTIFTPRTVDLTTSNTGMFLLSEGSSGRVVELFPNNFTPGSGVIKVIPAPAVWFALPLFAVRRRRK